MKVEKCPNANHLVKKILISNLKNFTQPETNCLSIFKNIFLYSINSIPKANITYINILMNYS